MLLILIGLVKLKSLSTFLEMSNLNSSSSKPVTFDWGSPSNDASSISFLNGSNIGSAIS